ncbi:MAG: IPT/TIG domain-containing protein [Patescibacteria group bacterium]|jgi:hypothetical protein
MFNRKNNFSKFLFLIPLLILFSFFIFNFSSLALAGDSFGTNFVEDEINLSSKDPRTMVSRIINISLSVLGIVAIIIIIFGGFIWMMSEGNEEKVAQAKNILKAGIIGLAIILASWGIASFVLNQLGKATGVAVVCSDGEIKSCGCEGVSTCSNGIWGSCVGSNCLPGSHGSSCSAGLGGVCLPDDSLCNSSLTCSEECECVYPGEGQVCGELLEGVCSPDNDDCSDPNLFCDSDSCLCSLNNFAELGDPCNNGSSCSAVNDVCNPNHGLSCDAGTCTCIGEPVITGFSPIGGFCENDINIPCLNDAGCVGSTCNFYLPNISNGNLFTVFGFNFDSYDPAVSQVNFIRNSDDTVVQAQNVKDLNANCSNTWVNDQIVVVLPTSSPFVSGNDLEVEVITKNSKSDRSRDSFGPQLELVKFNNISRPGLCGVSNIEARANEDIWYYGIKLNGGKAYFGNSLQNVLGFSPNTFDNEYSGVARVPFVGDGETSTFVQRSGVFSNLLDFKKLAEAPLGASISFFSPTTGPSGQYVTIYGSGFNKIQGSSEVYFVKENDLNYSKTAGFNFPEVCLHSVWSDNQIIVKVPENIDNGNYKIVVKINDSSETFSSQTFSVNSALSLSPNLCKISPISGPYNSNVSLWGEYFGSSASAVFSVNKNTPNVSVVSELGADKISVSVPVGAVTGPVKVNRDGNQGNSLNFLVGLCSVNSDCGSGNSCCQPGSSLAGSCVEDINTCFSDVPENSFFQWSFQTGFSTNEPTAPPDKTFSCASYNFCPTTSWVCPNMPGLCSSYEGGNPIVTGVCKDDCSSFSFCSPTGDDCSYNSNLDKCIYKNLDCSLSKKVEYILGTGGTNTIKDAVCQSYTTINGQRNYYEIKVNTACPIIDGTQWSMISSGRCVDVSTIGDNSTCSLCPSGSNCQLSADTGLGICASSKLCSGSSNCSGNECLKPDSSSCQCCCDKNSNTANGNPACCAPLTCDSTCGVSANDGAVITNFGLCSGCKISESTATSTRDLACNCSSVSGQFCETEGYSSGACLDCTSLKEGSCKEHSTTCCWDDKKDVCRGGAGDEAVWGEGSSNIGYCPYYSCDSSDITVCAVATPSITGDYSQTTDCIKACSDNCGQYKDFNDCNSLNNCCWKSGESSYPYNVSGSCLGGDKYSSNPADDYYGLCRYYSCPQNSTVCEASIAGSYLDASACNDFCIESPAGFNNSCTNINSSTSCSANACNKLECLQEDGSLGVVGDCGSCCCDPNAGVDQCGLINSNLNCVADKGVCTGASRGLCCGCSSDNDCTADGLDPEKVGCGFDTCCKARPEIEIDLNKNGNLSVLPEHGDQNVCRNSAVKIDFNKRIEVATLNNNILLLEESSGVCSPGTYFISKDNLYKKNIWQSIKELIIKKPLNYISRLAGKSVIASPSSDKVYCVVTGMIDFSHGANDKTSVYFKPNSLLKPSTNYFVVVKGDENLDSKTGIKSFEGVGMNGSGYFDLTGEIWLESDVDSPIKFNNLYYKNSYIFSFKTLDISTSGQGICNIDYALVSPSSYLFQDVKNDLNENDNDPSHSSFDSVRDKDKVYLAGAYSSDHQILLPSSSYNWTWNWSISNNSVLEFNNNVVGWSSDGDKKLVGVKDGVIDGQANIKAEVVLTPGNLVTIGNGSSHTVSAYVLLCKNPWPPVDQISGTWVPWRDSSSPASYNYEIYYCRDAGGSTTGDDLPAFVSDLAVTKGNSLIKICSNIPSKVCSTSADCGLGGICLSSFLKETYFFKEKIPHFIEDVSALDNKTGGSVKINWSSDKEIVDKYKIYYSLSNTSDWQSKIIDKDDSDYCSEPVGLSKYACEFNLTELLNDREYSIKITALSSNLAETNFSTTVFVTPTDQTVSLPPTNITYKVLPNRKVELSWTAPTGYSIAKYKIYRGTSSGIYATSFLTNDNFAGAVIDLSGTSINKYYMAVSSIGTNGIEGEKSIEFLVDLLNIE